MRFCKMTVARHLNQPCQSKLKTVTVHFHIVCDLRVNILSLCLVSHTFTLAILLNLIDTYLHIAILVPKLNTFCVYSSSGDFLEMRLKK